MQNSHGQILAVWILAVELPNSDLNFAVDFWVDVFLSFPRKKAPKKSTEKSPAKFNRKLVRKNSPWMSAEAHGARMYPIRVGDVSKPQKSPPLVFQAHKPQHLQQT